MHGCDRDLAAGCQLDRKGPDCSRQTLLDWADALPDGGVLHHLPKLNDVDWKGPPTRANPTRHHWPAQSLECLAGELPAHEERQARLSEINAIDSAGSKSDADHTGIGK